MKQDTLSTHRSGVDQFVVLPQFGGASIEFEAFSGIESELLCDGLRVEAVAQVGEDQFRGAANDLQATRQVVADVFDGSEVGGINGLELRLGKSCQAGLECDGVELRGSAGEGDVVAGAEADMGAVSSEGDCLLLE